RKFAKADFGRSRATQTPRRRGVPGSLLSRGMTVQRWEWRFRPLELRGRQQGSSVMAVHHLRQAEVIDGFGLDAPLDAGGMAQFWAVSRADAAATGPADADAADGDLTPFPMVMKVPLLRHGEDPVTIVGFEVEQMILPRLSGPHVP